LRNNVHGCIAYGVAMSERKMTSLRGRAVYLPDGRRLGLVHDAVVDFDGWRCSHLFVRETSLEIVEGGIHLAIPWRWVRAVSDVVLLRWFPPTPLPRDPRA
jgi:sporulation protein YlmC with PRC-barrel domain